MFKFFSEAKQELEHVVWPTQKETQKYMSYTVGVIVVMAIILVVLGYVMREGLSIVRDQFPHTTLATSVSGESEVKKRDLNSIINSFSGRTNKHTPIVSAETTGSGTIEVTPITTK